MLLFSALPMVWSAPLNLLCMCVYKSSGGVMTLAKTSPPAVAAWVVSSLRSSGQEYSSKFMAPVVEDS